MTLKDKLLADMKEAMKGKEASKLELAVIRMVRSAIKNAEIEKKRDLEEEEIMDILAREVKIRQDAIDSIPDKQQESRQADIDRLKEEKKILQEYLPAPLSDPEIKEAAREAIASTGVSSPKEMGRVMGVLMPRLKGRADGNKVKKVVQEMLSGEESD